MTLLSKEIFEIVGMMSQVFSNTWFIFLPPAFFFLFKTLWLDLVRNKYGSQIEWITLEIIPPRDIEKSPKLMESFFSGFAGVSKGLSVNEEFIKGLSVDKISLELVSDEGTVHFYIRTPKGVRNLVEANLYAQYPDAEIIEVEDYTVNVPKLVPNEEWDLWGSDFELVQPDPYPIKTYEYFEEDVTGKMIDPLSSILEVMGKIGLGQKMWFQCVISPEPEGWTANVGRPFVDEFVGRKSKPKGIIDRITTDIGDIFGNFTTGLMGGELNFASEEKAEEQPLEFRLTPGEKEVLKALETNIGKNFYNTKMRAVYLGRRENFNKANVAAFVGGLKQFNDMNLNNLKPSNESKTAANYLFTEFRLLFKQRRIFQRYINRDTKGKIFKMSTSELATIFHLPDMSVVAPSITRVDAKRSGAPANLPI